MLYETGRARTINVVPSPTPASPLVLDRPVPRGAALHPATIKDAEDMIAYLQEVIVAMSMPPRGEQRGNNTQNNSFL